MSLVEQKQNEEKQVLLEQLEHERQALANEVESQFEEIFSSEKNLMNFLLQFQCTKIK